MASAAGPEPRIRVLVVEDSRFMRGVIRAILAADPAIDVVGTAADGLEAVDAVMALRPDVVTMDVDMPRADGLAAVERIMAERPTPIVMISAHTRRDSAAAIRALELGAVDFVAKPSFTVDLGLDGLREEILRKVRVAARVRPVRTATRRRPPLAPVRPPAPRAADDGRPSDWTPCVVIAASTGGPAALLGLVPDLPADLPASVVIVQHMPAAYTTAFAAALAARSGLPVREAAEGEWLRRGVIYVNPGAQQLTLAPGGRVVLHAPPTREGQCPSADLVMMSVARRAGPRSVGVVLSGMGHDGAAGVRAIHRAGGVVIAQDEATSVVYGMPKAAVETGVVDSVVALDEVAPAIERRVRDLLTRVGEAQHAV
jgi:two-component system chemotaxis response regulator CheB